MRRLWYWLKDKWFLIRLDVKRVRELLTLNPVLVRKVLLVINDSALTDACLKARQKAIADSRYNQANEWLWDAEIAEWTRTYLREYGYDCTRAKAWFLAATIKYMEKNDGDR